MLADTHRAAQARLGDVTGQLLGALWTRTVDPTQLDKTFPAYASAAVPIVMQGRAASTKMARQYYASEAAAHGAAMVAVPDRPGNPEQIYRSLEATGPSRVKAATREGKTLDAANAAGVDGIKRSGKRHVLDGGREYIAEVVRKDPKLRACRVSRGTKTCSFCKALISRGPVYTPDSVKFHSHDGCDCGWRIVYPDDADGGWTDEAKQLRDLWNRYPDLREFEAANRLLMGETQRSLLLGDDISALLRAERAASLARESKFLKDFADAIEDLPDDLSTIGKVDKSQDLDDALRAATDRECMERCGLSWDDLQKRHALLDKQAKALEELQEWFHNNIDFNSKKWPANKPTDLLKALGWERRHPGTVYAGLRDASSKIWSEKYALDTAYSGMKGWLEMAQKYPEAFAKISRWGLDLDDIGKLGASSKKALNAILRAGKVLDDEINRRMALHSLPDPSDYIKFHELRDQLRANYMAGLKTDFDIWNAAEELRPRAEVYAKAAAKLRADTSKEVLSELRDMGGGARPTYKMLSSAKGHTKDMRAAMDNAHSIYPTSWNDRFSAMAPEVKLGFDSRGYNSDGGHKIVISADGNAVGPGGAMGHTSVHEMGHSMEQAIDGLKGLEWAFHYERSAKQYDEMLGMYRLADKIDLYNNGREWAVPDKWYEHYSGKDYSDLTKRLGPDESWEIFTTGVESVFEGSPYFGPMHDDAEFRQFILGVLGAL